ncbi:MAG TPA: response regulator transcription factor [Acidobacteriaceae bacterium]|jgi:DNA-binding NarL/FixJ family response regulator|nr:response regulator transcription factor [Acidobacteriaceae bacterium]
MTRQVSQPVSDPRIRVGVLGIAPMRAVGLQALFDGHPEILIVQRDILELMHDPLLRILILGARSSASLTKLMATVKAYRADIRMIVMSGDSDEETILNVIAAGSKGHIDNGATVAEFQQAIQIVAAGSLWAPRHVLSLLIERVTDGLLDTRTAAAVSFTKRERDVLELLIAGRSNKEIARALHIEDHTVKVYVGKLMRKVGVKSRTALTMHVVTNALLDAKR